MGSKWCQFRGAPQGKNLFVTFLLLGHVLRAQVSLFPRCFLFAKHDSSLGFPAKRERKKSLMTRFCRGEDICCVAICRVCKASIYINMTCYGKQTTAILWVKSNTNKPTSVPWSKNQHLLRQTTSSFWQTKGTPWCSNLFENKWKS